MWAKATDGLKKKKKNKIFDLVSVFDGFGDSKKCWMNKYFGQLVHMSKDTEIVHLPFKIFSTNQ